MLLPVEQCLAILACRRTAHNNDEACLRADPFAGAVVEADPFETAARRPPPAPRPATAPAAAAADAISELLGSGGAGEVPPSAYASAV